MNAETQILAVQAFVQKGHEGRIVEACDAALKIGESDPALEYSGNPHVTIASWRVTREELGETESTFEERLQGLYAQEVQVSVEGRGQGNRLCYFLIPQVTQELEQFHHRIHEKLACKYEPFRNIDLPGSWWAHMTLFSVQVGTETSIEHPLSILGEIGHITMTRLGLVAFQPTKVIREVSLKV